MLSAFAFGAPLSVCHAFSWAAVRWVSCSLVFSLGSNCACYWRLIVHSVYYVGLQQEGK
jgi:hypothetical protein